MTSTIKISAFRRRASERGFTLLEVLVATAIMGLTIAGVMSGLAAAARNADRLTQYDRAAYLAQQRMDEILVDHTLPRGVNMEGPFTPQQSGVSPDQGELGWMARVDPYEALGTSVAGAGYVIDRVQVEVWWTDGLGRRSLALEGFRRGLLRPEDAGLPVILNSGSAP